MPIARWKDLCIDAVDADRMAAFWASTLGLRVDRSFEQCVRLVGDEPAQTVWVNRVPEPRTVKQRVHVDVVATTDTVPGTTPLSAPGEFPWRVLADPEGGELCVFVREEVPSYLLHALVVDCADPGAVARWWGDVLGGELGSRPENDWHWIVDVPGLPFGSIDFVPVPEPKTVKNRVHWDLDVDSPSAIDELVARGATVLRRPDDEIGWTVLADPEGNEFCVFVAEDMA